jgi:hypothetical protein
VKLRALFGLLPLVACQAVLGLEDTVIQTPNGDAGQGGEQPEEVAPSHGGIRPGQGGQDDGGGANGSLHDQGGASGSGAPPSGGALETGAGGTSDTGGAGETGGASEAGGTGGTSEAGGMGGEIPAEGGTASVRDDDWPKHSPDRLFKVSHPWPYSLLTACVRIGTSDVAAGEAFWHRVQAIIEDNWLRAADLALIFEGACDPPESAFFQFNIGDAPGRESELGFPGGGLSRVITLGVTSSDAEVLYAFGRALGFEHEYGRDPYAGRCLACVHDRDCTQPGRPSCLGTGYCGSRSDHESIMAAPDCGGIDPHRVLTHWDVLAAQRAYGRKPAGSLLGSRNLCWNAETGVPATNLRITAWPCLRADNELWHRQPTGDDVLLQATIATQPFCAAATGAGGTRPLLTQSCATTEASQTFQFRSMKLLTLGGLCLTAKSAEAGSELWTTECDTWAHSATADWDFVADRIRLANSNLCLTVRDGTATVDGVIQLEPCDATTPRQKLMLIDSEIRFYGESGGLVCFNVAAGTGIPGERVTLWDGCGFGYENEHFMARGRVEANGRCADMLGETPLIATPIGMTTCDGDASQIWDYYW